MATLPAMAFIEVAIPSAGASGRVLRTRFLARSGYSVEASTFSLILETIYLGVMMTTVALTGIFILTLTKASKFPPPPVRGRGSGGGGEGNMATSAAVCYNPRL